MVSAQFKTLLEYKPGCKCQNSGSIRILNYFEYVGKLNNEMNKVKLEKPRIKGASLF
jgi:hypothetical protein